MFQRSSWEFKNDNIGLSINKIPNYFNTEKIDITGDHNTGSLSIQSYDIKEPIWGANATLSIEWNEVNPLIYHHGIEVEKTIGVYSAINVIVLKKEQIWHLAHDMTIWHGKRQKFKQRRMFSSRIIHATMMCDQSNRVFEIHAEILDMDYHIYENPIIELIKSIECHPL